MTTTYSENSKMKLIENILNENETELLLNNEIVIKHKNLLEMDKNKHKSINFSILLTPDIIDKLNNGFSSNLKYNTEIPFKWVKGDTVPHSDKSNEGEHFITHLVYLTENSGKFKIDNREYSIKKGCGYIFDEGLVHETINTQDTFKLILGPFNSNGVGVGPDDLRITTLSISSGTLSPTFSPTTLYYTANVSNATDSLTVTSIVNSQTLSYISSINGGATTCFPPSSTTRNFPLNEGVGSNTIQFELFTSNNCGVGPSPNVYTLIVTRDPVDLLITTLSISSGTLSPTFSPTTLNYTASVSNATDSLTVTSTYSQTTVSFIASINGDGLCFFSTLTNLNFLLNVGSNTIQFNLFSSNNCGVGPSPNVYILIVTRDPAPPAPPATPTYRMKMSLYSDNSLVYYKPHSLAAGGTGTTKNCRHKARKT